MVRIEHRAAMDQKDQTKSDTSSVKKEKRRKEPAKKGLRLEPFRWTNIIIKQAIDGNFTLDPFIYGKNTAGWTGFQNAILFAVLAIAAFDIVAPMAEETRTPRSLVPKATILVTIGAGLYWVFTSFGFVIAVPASTMGDYVNSGQFTPIYLVADHYIGLLRILVPLTGVTAVFAAFTAISVTAARLLYALSREGLAPRMFAETDENKTPWNAQALVLACCVVLPIVIVLWQDRKPLNAFGWIGVSYVFYVLIPYTLVCVANIVYHLRIARDQFNVFTNAFSNDASLLLPTNALGKHLNGKLSSHSAPS